jgi:hypothetical protein
MLIPLLQVMTDEQLTKYKKLVQYESQPLMVKRKVQRHIHDSSITLALHTAQLNY